MSDQIKFWLNAAGRYELLAEDELLELCNQRNKADVGSEEYLSIVNKITEHNLRLVANVCTSFCSKSFIFNMGHSSTGDLLQSGYLGLRRAAEKYDPTRGYKFSTYAVPWIRQAMQRYQYSSHQMIRVPEATTRELMYQREHGKRSNIASSPKDDRLIQAASLANGCGSTDILLDEDGSRLSDLLGQENSLSYEDPSASGRRCPSLDAAMDAAGIPSKTQELMRQYSRRGNMMVASCKSGFSPKEGSKLIRATIAELQAQA